MALRTLVALALTAVSWLPGYASKLLAAAEPPLLYTRDLGVDEDSSFVTFLGKGVLMLSEEGHGTPGTARVYDAASGALHSVLACPPRDERDVGEYCPFAVAASAKLLVLSTSSRLQIFRRDGTFLRTIDTDGPVFRRPDEYLAFGFQSLAVRGRYIAIGGSAYEDGVQVSGVAVYLFNGVTGKLLERKVIPCANPDDRASVAFAGRILVVGTPHCAADGGRVSAFDRSTGKLLWSRAKPDEPRVGDEFGHKVVGLGSDVVVSGGYLLDGRTGELKRAYLKPDGSRFYSYVNDVAARGNRVALTSYPDVVYVFAAGSGALLHTIGYPLEEACDGFPTSVALSATRLVATEGSWCGTGNAFVFGLP